MAPLPKRRLSKARGRKRFAGKTSIKTVNSASYSLCANCKKPTLAHMACAICGYYKGIKTI